MPAKVHVKKGDMVEVRRGDDRGRRGKILSVHPAKVRVVVDGVNIQKKHRRPTRTNPQGGVSEQPGPLAAARVMLVCPHCNKATRVSTTRTAEGPVRVCKRCGKTID